MNQEESIPFDIDNEKEQLRSISKLRDRIDREEREIDLSKHSFHDDNDLFPVHNSENNHEMNLLGEEKPITSQQLSNENEILKENERLLRSRIETLEQIVEIQNDEIQKSLSSLASQDGPVPDLPPYLTKYSSSVPDLFYQLLKRWRSKVYETLIEKKSVGIELEKSKKDSSESIEKSKRIEKELQYIKRLKEQEIESTHLQLQIERRKTILLKKQLDTSREQEKKQQVYGKHRTRIERQARKILETFLTSSLPKSSSRSITDNDDDVKAFGFSYQNEKFENTVLKKIETSRKRLEFVQNRVGMVKGIMTERLRTSLHKVDELRKENDRLKENLLFRRNARVSGSRDSNLEIIERLEGEVERLKRERNFLLERKRKEGREAHVQAGNGEIIPTDEEEEEIGKVERLESCLKRAEQSIQSNLAVMIQLRKKFEEINSVKEVNEKNYRKSIADLRERVEIGGKKESILYQEILKKDEEIKGLRKQLISRNNNSNNSLDFRREVVKRVGVEDDDDEDDNVSNVRSRTSKPVVKVEENVFRKRVRRKQHRHDLRFENSKSRIMTKKRKKGRRKMMKGGGGGPEVQDSVILKLNALNNITDQILSENLESFDEDTLFMK